MKQKLSSFYSRLLSACLVLLGFNACGNQPDEYGVLPVEYGIPSAKYNIQGKVVSSDAAKKPIEDIRVVVIQTVDKASFGYVDNPYLGYDTIYTNSDGRFKYEQVDFPGNRFEIKFQDIDGEENGLFEDKEQIIEFDYSDLKGGSGWYAGEAKKDMGIIELKPKKAEN